MTERYIFNEVQCQNLAFSGLKEWVLPNGIGGFAMGTIAGINTRRYHGLLIAALNPPTDRTLLFAAIEATVQVGNVKMPLSNNQYPGAIYPEGYQYLRKFELGEAAHWTYKKASVTIKKSVKTVHGHNKVEVSFENLGLRMATIILRPLVCFRDFHSNFSERISYPNSIELGASETVIEEDGHSLVFSHPAAERVPVHGWYYRFEHARELERGLDPRDDLYCPFELRYEVPAGEKITLSAEVKGYEADVQPPLRARENSISSDFEHAARAFIVKSENRTSILAGFPWFSDWGRDTMISLPGICLVTGHFSEARQILRDYASQLYQGLIPNRFVEKGERADYNTVDATLWFGNAIYKTLEAEWDEEFAKEMFGCLTEIVDWHQKGTLYGIKVDPVDGLLFQGEDGTQLTWMDAKIGDWVVTPRHGKPVEINGLWINLLRVTEGLAVRLSNESKHYKKAAELAEAHFDAKFWHPVRGHYLDTADPADATLRPNQLIAMSLPFSPCKPEHAKLALKVVEKHLVTPFGLRTLGPEEPGYVGRFKGPMATLDACYHQGTVWPWLFGPYITSLVKYVGSKSEARKRLKMVKEMIADCGIGGISECYDGDEPHTPGGCPWQAWSVAEILRCWKEDVGGD
jgi:glycogen debranching enzyme